jgi:hypothetical protein
MILFTSVFMFPGMAAIFFALGLNPSSWKKSQESIQAFADQESIGRTTLNPDATPSKTLFIAVLIRAYPSTEQIVKGIRREGIFSGFFSLHGGAHDVTKAEPLRMVFAR